MATKSRRNRTLVESEILRAEDVLERPSDPFPPFVPPIVRAEDVMAHPDDLLPDPPKRVDMQQERNIRYSADMLEEWLEDWDEDSVVTTEAYLCDTTAPPGDTTMVKPDTMVGFGITFDALLEFSNGWVIRDMGYPPAYVLEVASKTTGGYDYTRKREIYMKLRVPEIFRFDATGGEYHDAPLAGDRLVGDEYVSVEVFDCPEYAEDGALHARIEALKLDICWRDGILRYYDPVGATHFLNRLEAREARLRLEARVEAESEARQRAEAENRLLHEEISRLRGE